MREIKFRAWCKDENTMYYDAQGTYDYMTGVPATSFGDLLNDEDWLVMQYTGLTDKNGKEIYEGDLLRTPSLEEYDKKNYVVYEVFWHDNDCCDNHIGFQINRVHFQGNLCGTNLFYPFKPKYTNKMEVIGNIYENKELIK